MTRIRITFAIGIAGLFVGCVGVTESLNPSFCTNALGNRTCAEHYPDGSRPYCVVSECLNRDFGCVAEVPTDACASPCGAEDPACELSDGSSTSTGPGTESSSGEGDTESDSSESSTTGPMPCERDEDCAEAEAPFCEPVSGECVSCEGMADPDAACAGADPGLPLCVGGACVQCTAAASEACSGNTPVCDEATNTCVPCTAHAQCGEAACNLYIGACLPGEADAIAHVGPGQEVASLNDALMSFPGTEGTVVVHAGPSYDEFVTVDGGRTVAFLAADGDLPLWVLTAGGAPQLEVTAGSTILIDGLQVSDGDLGLRVNGGRAWVDRSRIIQNSGGGIVAEAGAELVLRNCFVGGADNSAAVDVDGATALITFSTLGGGTINAAGLSCTAPDVVDVRSSIIMALGIMATGGVDVACSVADISYTATETGFVGTGNVAVGELPFMTPDDWFVNYGIGDFHLQNDGLTFFADIAQWQTGDPPIDIDGDPRPVVDGAPDYTGADVPQ